MDQGQWGTDRRQAVLEGRCFCGEGCRLSIGYTNACAQMLSGYDARTVATTSKLCQRSTWWLRREQKLEMGYNGDGDGDLRDSVVFILGRRKVGVGKKGGRSLA